MSYKYKRPEGKLYKVSMAKWSRVFARRGRWPLIVAEVYVTDDYTTVQFVPSVIGRVYFAVVLPVIYFFGVYEQGAKDTNSDVLDILFTKRRGAFSSDMVHRDKGDQWDKLMGILD